jgi:hypothetical protein
VQLDREAEDLLKGLLTWDPQQRLGSKGAHQIQRHPFFASVPWGSLLAEVARDQQRHEELRLQELQRGGGNGSSGSRGGGYTGAHSSAAGGGSYGRMSERAGGGSARRRAVGSESETPALSW